MCPSPPTTHDDADDEDIGSGSVRFTKDYVGLDYHNEGHTHIDAFCHVAFEGSFFDGHPNASVTAHGADAGSTIGIPARRRRVCIPTAATFLADREVAALGADGNHDTAPSSVEGVAFPMHVLALNAMGVHLLDYLQFEDLVRQCETAERWEFLFVAAPLRIERGTGSPLNPIAISDATGAPRSAAGYVSGPTSGRIHSEGKPCA